MLSKIIKAYDIRGVVPTTLHEGVAEALRVPVAFRPGAGRGAALPRVVGGGFGWGG